MIDGGAMSTFLNVLGVSNCADLAGINVALIETDGDEHVSSGPSLHIPYRRDIKIFLRRAIAAAREGREGAADIGKAGGEITIALIAAVETFLEREKIKRKDIDVIGIGGHELLHRPPADGVAGLSWRIGDGKTVAEETRIDVVSDFCAGDIAAGGHGAPLAPVFFRALVASISDRPQCAVGVVSLDEAATRVVYAPENALASDLIAYDVAPGLAWIDGWKSLRKETAADAPGEVDAEALRLLLLNPFLRLPPPKSLELYEFKLDLLRKLQPADGRATLAAFIVNCLAQSEQFLPEPPGGYIICGEGRRRDALISMLSERLEAEIAVAEDAGWEGDRLGAACLAFLAARSLKKLPLTYPKTTRTTAPTRGGIYHRAPV